MMIGLATAFPLLLALMFFMTDLDAVMTSPLPSMELIYQALVPYYKSKRGLRMLTGNRTGNRSVTIFLESILLVVYIRVYFSFPP